MTVLLPPPHPIASSPAPASSSSSPWDRSTLSTDQQAKLDRLRDHFVDEAFTVETLPVGSCPAAFLDPSQPSTSTSTSTSTSASPTDAANATTAPAVVEPNANNGAAPADDDRPPPGGRLTEREQFWLTEECLLRFLRATKWDVAQAEGRLERTLAWRRAFGVDRLTKEYLSPEAETGKQIIYGYDNERRPIWYMRPALQNTSESDRQIHQVVFTLSLAEALMPRGVETLDLFIDFGKRGKSPSMGTSKRVLYILQDHYPERLGTAYVINVPFLIRGFFRLISPLLDPLTRSKLFLPSSSGSGGSLELAQLAPAEQVEQSFGGTVDFGTYDEETHQGYWWGEQGVCRLAERRRERAFEVWRKLGGGVGRREWDIKEGEASWD